MQSKPKDRFKIKVGVFLFVQENNQVLLIQRFNTGTADGQHVLPMGGLDDGETTSQAIIREAFEEVNVSIQPENLQLVHVSHRLYNHKGNTFPQIDFYFKARIYEGTIYNKEPHKCSEVKFYPIDDLPPTTEPFIVEAIRRILNNEYYSEIGWNKISKGESYASEIYESTGNAYDNYRKADPVILNKIAELLSKPDGKYLDIGCGSGNYTIGLANLGFNIEGLDLSPTMLAKAAIKKKDLTWTQGSMESLPYPPNAFDGIVSMNTLHYVRHTLPEVFVGIKKALKPNGSLILFALSLEQCLQYWVGRYFPFFWEVGKKALPTKSELLAALKIAGFSDIHIEPFYVTEKTEDFFSYACKYRPHLFLEPSIREVMTPFQLPEYAEEVRKGCEHLRKDILSGAIQNIIHKHESSLGEGYFIKAARGDGDNGDKDY